MSAEVISAHKAVHLERRGSIHACLEQIGIRHVLMQGMARAAAHEKSRADLRPYTPAESPPSTSYSGAPSAPIASACRSAELPCVDCSRREARVGLLRGFGPVLEVLLPL